MSVTKDTIQAMFTAARTAFSGANVTIRHNGREYTGTRLPADIGRVVDEGGAMFTVSGGVRLLTSEFASVWPKVGDKIEIRSTESGRWITYIMGPPHFDEMDATMLVIYGELYDQEGV